MTHLLLLEMLLSALNERRVGDLGQDYSGTPIIDTAVLLAYVSIRKWTV
jgi:hypothetical protein